MDKINIKDIELKTDRLSLRAFEEEDLEDLYAYAKEPGLGESAGWFHHESIEDSRKVLDSFIKDANIFALVYEGKVVGSIGLHPYDEEFFTNLAGKKAVEIGFVIGSAYQKKGLMQEALERVLEFLFKDIGLDYVVAGHFRGNFKSKKIQMKLGFKYYSSHLIKTQMGTSEVVHENILSKEDFDQYLLDKEKEKSRKYELAHKKQIINRYDLKEGENFSYQLNFSNALIFVISGLISYDTKLYIGSDLIQIDKKDKVDLKVLRDASFILVENNFGD